jgi:hypothetical protein
VQIPGPVTLIECTAQTKFSPIAELAFADILPALDFCDHVHVHTVPGADPCRVNQQIEHLEFDRETIYRPKFVTSSQGERPTRRINSWKRTSGHTGSKPGSASRKGMPISRCWYASLRKTGGAKRWFPSNAKRLPRKAVQTRSECQQQEGGEV